MTFHSPSNEELLNLLKQASPTHLQEILPALAEPQLTQCARFLDEHSIPNAFSKLSHILEQVNESNRLESFARGLSTNQFLMILEHLSQTPSLKHKLSPLLVGLPSPIFLQTLEKINPLFLNCLKHESMTEPLQHLLTLFIHDCEHLLQTTHESVVNHMRLIHELQPQTLSFEELEDLEAQIFKLHQVLIARLEAINHAQAILWNANRIDLIDKLSQLKEQFFFLLKQIGHASDTEPAAGLYQALEEHLAQIFTAADPSLDIDTSLQDEDSALEGFTKFSIWYFKDYWELGLLPSLKQAEQLELDPATHSEQELLNHRQQLFMAVQESLDKLKLSSVRDLKKARIFSKSLLEHYIKAHRHLLT
ncbi:Conserved hypothetical protein [Candidatus Protochlamydia naegleriophila]|uniref:Uncharacterized protein n=1 Tax=Candidatus Protochlamydia naegleriophila TaxID=389348 RepID=A0A0U5CP39_9BACT|nr:hypothetical protein [Candidatus Protochlamydia naegleriophila]CUI16476.1 Conserved hypothetical protein [Candidatus Protochlamydia naegleriophila]